MMKRGRLTSILIIIIIINISLGFFINSNNKNIITWENSKQLKWEYFNGDPIMESKFSAYSTMGISRNYNEKDFIKIMVKTLFVKDKSWVKPNPSDNLLKHEQGHFNLFEIYARKLRKIYIENSDSIDIDYYNYQYKVINEYLDSITIKYDKETDFSRNIKEQERWNDSIVVWLDKYKDYSDTLIIIDKY